MAQLLSPGLRAAQSLSDGLGRGGIKARGSPYRKEALVERPWGSINCSTKLPTK